jgi:gastric triacylglycerol lipase
MCHDAALAGFDVWMANTRGNTFSRGNYDYSFRDPLYWRHSIDQYALVDAPAQIDMALQVSGAKKLAVVGHSQVGSACSHKFSPG